MVTKIYQIWLPIQCYRGRALVFFVFPFSPPCMSAVGRLYVAIYKNIVKTFIFNFFFISKDMFFICLVYISITQMQAKCKKVAMEIK